jgi:hypothetical protein
MPGADIAYSMTSSARAAVIQHLKTKRLGCLKADRQLDFGRPATVRSAGLASLKILPALTPIWLYSSVLLDPQPRYFPH